MIINQLRKELTELFVAADHEERKPALRRSLREEWLYAADLPAYMDESALENISGRLSRIGWESMLDGAWLQLRKAIKEPPSGWHTGGSGTEAACCLSLLIRHPDRIHETEQKAEYLLIKGREQGENAFEDACRRLHHEWAVRLRKGSRLPDINIRFFTDQ